ncbi:MAG: 50S ribosomal protein L18 [Candidatus Diapherotrites archaeon]|nr:50S ribosomal protein L18 [Candidatus Micrarchaeota archaeon]MBU1939509.1 50S ribosomal protein L18 [Candidatus Micrarchaeota archaeon]
MSHTSTYETPFRRRREDKTNYVKRFAMLKSGMPRLVVRKSNNTTIVQLAEFVEKGDVMLAVANSHELKALGWKGHGGNLPAAYLTGMLCGKRALDGKFKGNEGGVIADIGLNTPVHGSRVFAAIKGAIDAGLKVKCDEKAFPAEDRIGGKHISDDVAAQFSAVKDAIAKKGDK